MKKYPKYKDSEVQWIGEIPENWAVRRINSLFKQRSETVSDKDFSPLSVTKNGILPQIEGVAKTENNDARKLVRTGDFVINSRSDRKGSSGTSRYDGSVSVINIVLEPHSIDPLYAEFLFKSNEFVEEYFRNGKGIVWDLWSTRYSEMKYILIPNPPLSEQQQIVTYLDHKTTLIDQIISGSAKKIELLKEQRTATINHAVTKGLNPKVKMKDSGVEWIGEIPEGWARKKIKTLSEIISKGTTPTTIGKEILDEGEIRYLKSENIVDNKVSEYPRFFIDSETNNILKRSILLGGDLLFVIAGASLGKVAILPQELSPSNTNQAVSFIRLKKNENRKYTWYWLTSSKLQEQIWLDAVQSAQPNLSMENLGNFFIPYPPLSEQEQIVASLDKKTKEIDDLIASEKKRIELLKEYRQSLISEVVTGKIKVTNG